ncbi:hypothetical protein GWO09_16250 [candidate division KSB1 bacterium]|nr:hypothetical protein [candidate division KSB1 bacterium]
MPAANSAKALSPVWFVFLDEYYLARRGSDSASLAPQQRGSTTEADFAASPVIS